jgi:hypothetical protein
MRPLALASYLALIALTSCAAFSSSKKPPAPSPYAPADDVDDLVENHAVTLEWYPYDAEMSEAALGNALDLAVQNAPGDWRVWEARAAHYVRIGALDEAQADHDRARELVAAAEPEYVGDFPANPTTKSWWPGYTEEDLLSDDAEGDGLIVDFEMSPAALEGRDYVADYATCTGLASRIRQPSADGEAAAVVLGALAGAAQGAVVGGALPGVSKGEGAALGAAAGSAAVSRRAEAIRLSRAGRRNEVLINCLTVRGWVIL